MWPSRFQSATTANSRRARYSGTCGGSSASCSNPGKSRNRNDAFRRCRFRASGKVTRIAATRERASDVGRHEGGALGGEVAAVVGELAPQPAGLPPASVGGPIAEAHQQAQDERIDQAPRPPPVDHPELERLDHQAGGHVIGSHGEQQHARALADDQDVERISGGPGGHVGSSGGRNLTRDFLTCLRPSIAIPPIAAERGFLPTCIDY